MRYRWLALLAAVALCLPAHAEAPPKVKLKKALAVGPAPSDLPSLAPLVQQVGAAVVNVEVKSRVQLPGSLEGQEDFWDRFFGGQQRLPKGHPRDFTRQGQGSGFIIETNGLVLTNNHVVTGATAIQVKLEDGRRFDAEIAGRDPLTDVAVIRLKGVQGSLPAVRLGDSEALQVGDWVVAIGNPFGLASSVSLGIISARARQLGAGPYDDFLQTDAAINPGNSGGPLFNLRGEVIGMNTAIAAQGAGIGFAVPSNLIKALLPNLEKGQPIVRGWLGVAIQDLTPELAKGLGVPASRGAVVSDVTAGTPAAKAGLRPDDVVVAIDGQPVDTAGELSSAVALKKPGATVTLTLYREGRKEDRPVALGTRPDLEGVQSERARDRTRPQRQQSVGLSVEDITPDVAREQGVSGGALISDVRPGSAADDAELEAEMIVVEAGGKPVKRAEDLRRALKEAKPGTVLLLRIQTEHGRMLRALSIPERGGR